MHIRNLSTPAIGIILGIAFLIHTDSAQAQPVPAWEINFSRITMLAIRFADVDGNGVKDIILP